MTGKKGKPLPPDTEGPDPEVVRPLLDEILPAPVGILDYRAVRLTDDEAAGGTNGSRIALDSDGRRWLVKSYGGDRDRVASELLANAIYREFGIPVPHAGIGSWPAGGGGAGIAIAYPMIAGELRRWNDPNETLAEGFVVDALLANWDVIGKDHDNILWQGDLPIRLDQGGCFEFRAMGKRKDYGPEPVELETMLGPLGQAGYAMAVTPELIRTKAAQTASLLTPETTAQLTSAAPFEDAAMRERLERNLESRAGQLALLAQSYS